MSESSFDDEDEELVTIEEYFDMKDAKELTYEVLLGEDEGKVCTYHRGYMTRQAVFACLTCTPHGKAGICIACALNCHEEHQVVEMGLKRKFRCDCGNSKFNGVECRLYNDKDSENHSNAYNRNFRGKFCMCRREVPDLDEMLQCCICEDWFHEDHLGLNYPEEVPRDEDGELAFGELVCPRCAKSCRFLSSYPDILIQPVILNIHESGLVNGSCQNVKATGKKAQEVSALTIESGKSVSVQDPTCKLKSGGKTLPSVGKKAIFLDKFWRNKLCQCPDCQKMYESQKLTFLLDPEDPFHEYEKKAKERRAEKLKRAEEAEVAFFEKLGHVEKMEFLYGFIDLTESLKSFLHGFQESGRAPTCADVLEFFEKRKKKRERAFQ